MSMVLGITPLNRLELENCARTLIQPQYPNEFTDNPALRNRVVMDIFAAMYRTRFGVAPGSVAVKFSTGETAVRHYNGKKFVWQINSAPGQEPLEWRIVDDLPTYGWNVTERPWQELVLKGLT